MTYKLYYILTIEEMQELYDDFYTDSRMFWRTSDTIKWGISWFNNRFSGTTRNLLPTKYTRLDRTIQDVEFVSELPIWSAIPIEGTIFDEL